MKAGAAISVAVGLLSLPLGARAADSNPPPAVWSAPVRISEPGTFNWFPDVAVDVYGAPHVVWDASRKRDRKSKSVLLHSQLDGGAWTKPFDVVTESGVESNIWRGSVTADDAGFLYIQEQVAVAYVRKVSARRGGVTEFHRLRPFFLAYGAFYMGAISAQPGGRLHVLFDMLTEVKDDDPRTPPALGDVYYVRGEERGKSWSEPLNLSATAVGETREKLEVDARGVIYASWDEGWDRPTWHGKPERGVLRVSRDQGRTWSPRITFEEPGGSNAQLAIAGDGRGGVLAVWRAATRDDAIFYAWSRDDGASWSATAAIPGLLARVWSDTPFDAYDVAVDSAGTIHLLAVGRRDAEDEASQLHHLSWDGEAWSAPALVHAAEGWPEYPRVVVSEGNRLHAVWFVRDQLATADGLYQVWYADATSAVPAVPLPRRPSSITTGMVANFVGGIVAVLVAVVVVRMRRRETAAGGLG